jgi:hypothetical protein
MRLFSIGAIFFIFHLNVIDVTISSLRVHFL